MVDWRSNDRRKPGECEAEQEDRNEWRMRECTVLLRNGWRMWDCKAGGQKNVGLS